MGIGIALEISHITHLRIFPLKKSLSGLQLRRNRTAAKRGRERGVVAIHASAAPQGAVAVRAAETGVDRKFLNFPLEVPCQKISVIPVIYAHEKSVI